MKTRKPIFKWLAWMLAFFLVTAGVAGGAERCKGKCCQEVRQSSGRDFGASKTSSCEDESTPLCCRLGKAPIGFPALVVKGDRGGVNRPFHGDMALSIHTPELSNENETRTAVAGWVLHPRAAPVPLYLKNTSFIC